MTLKQLPFRNQDVQQVPRFPMVWCWTNELLVYVNECTLIIKCWQWFLRKQMKSIHQPHVGVYKKPLRGCIPALTYKSCSGSTSVHHGAVLSSTLKGNGTACWGPPGDTHRHTPPVWSEEILKLSSSQRGSSGTVIQSRIVPLLRL